MDKFESLELWLLVVVVAVICFGVMVRVAPNV